MPAPATSSPFEARLREAIDEATVRSRRVPQAVVERLVDVGLALYGTDLSFPPLPVNAVPPEDLDEASQLEWAELAHLWDLETRRLKEVTPQALEGAIINSLVGYAKHWPESGADGPFTMQYAQAVNIAEATFDITAFLRDEHLKSVGAFKQIREAFNANVRNVSARQRRPDNPVYPQDYTGPKRTIPEAYFRSTPLKELLEVEVPLPLYDKTRYETHWIRGEPGTGKSTFLSHMIQYDLSRVEEGCSVIIMDSQGAKGLAQRVARLPLFEKGGQLEGRLVYISPRHYTLALNPFKLKRREEQYINGSVALFEYAMGGVEDLAMTRLQAGAFRRILHDLFTKADANLDLLEQQIEKSRELAKPTKDGIMGRLTSLRSVPSIDRMLNAPQNKLDLEEALAKGSVVCIDVDNGFFRDDAITEAFGRLFIALILQATQERTDIPEERLTPTFFYVDEAQDFVRNDPKAAKIIYQARKQCLGMVIANHNDTQIKDPDVKEALHGSRIFSQCIRPGMAKFWLRGQEDPIELSIEGLSFPKSGRWAETLADQEGLYGARQARGDIPDFPDSAP